ncbi:hypothetical protein K7X08_034298 [Anisodus acutangulus]|uniref:PUM-HD domain-containing protein n=1 Tax=Anisodus acutangulus TaxID=402998 RepID=A0A9Q1LF67_9SOLA|nr:hypothetical protein K7X08_034298 [Anisodus acutangulus]
MHLVDHLQWSGTMSLFSCVESACGELRDRLITEILTNVVQLSEDQHGNYVVQHLVGLKLPLVTETLLDRLQGNFVTLSCNRYASNVVEKIILESGKEHSTRIITSCSEAQVLQCYWWILMVTLSSRQHCKLQRKII